VARSLRLPAPARWLAITALPFAVMTSYPSIAHAVEAALLCNALAEQAAGRPANALALATAACFAKPSMGYVYGFILLVIGIAELYRSGGIGRARVDWGAIGRMLAPAAATAGALAMILGYIYGPRSLIMTLVPLAGMKNYAALNFGFFRGFGSYFWHGTPIRFYFVSVVGFWIAASIWLAAAGLVSLWRLISGADESSRARQEFVATTAIMHTLFVTAFFAGPMSWSFYSYVLVLGAMASCTTRRLTRFAVAALVVTAATGQAGFRAADIGLWRTRDPSTVTAGLWATTRERSTLAQAVAALHGRRAELISAQGAAPLLFPSAFEHSDYAYLLPGVTSDKQFARVIANIAAAPLVVAVVAPDYGDALDFWPQIKPILARRELVMKNYYYAAYRDSRSRGERKRPPGAAVRKFGALFTSSR
ncbi:MAG TPA: hypothetical protein VJ718_03395, partial [Candidatus Binataceae bacterium]|nr:hypothetical protein [Candidatus Binataceae bacterium]